MQEGSRPGIECTTFLAPFSPHGGQSKLCSKPHLIRNKSNKSLVFIAAGFLDLRRLEQIWKHRLHLPDVFSRRRRLGRSGVSSPKSCHGPKLVFFMWYEIYFSSRSVWEQPIWEEALFAPLLVFRACLSPPPSCTFQGNSHDESAERGEFVNVSNMLRGIWEWSAITQTRSTEEEDRAPNFRGGRRGSQKLSLLCTTFYCLWQSTESTLPLVLYL